MSYIESIDERLANILIQASLQAYAAFDKDNPAVCKRVVLPDFADYEFVDCWTGVDALFSDAHIENYGVVFRSKTPPHTYLFAFRGTDSLADDLQDIEPLFQDSKVFLPFEATTAPDPAALVASGFWEAYTNSDSAAGIRSMQCQLFDLLRKYSAQGRIGRIYVTGHSLGAALCQLFTLDLALSEDFKTIPAVNYNFASPRLGSPGFVALFEAQKPQRSATTRTVRIQNVHDYIPCLPFDIPDLDWNYQHTAISYLLAFRPDSWWDPFDFTTTVLESHSAEAYRSVMQCAFASSQGACKAKLRIGPGTGDGFSIESTVPDPDEVCGAAHRSDWEKGMKETGAKGEKIALL